MRHITLLFALLAAPAFAQSELRQLYTVTGVAENDTLNVRARPSASAADMGDLRPGETVAIQRLSEDGKWGRVLTGEAAGWVSMRFLRKAPDGIGLAADLPYGMPAEMACSGTEPFWGLHLLTGAYVESFDFNEEGAAQTYPMTGAANMVNRSTDHFAFTAPPLTGFLSREICDDGMSEAEYGWRLDLLWQRNNGLVLMQGCCTALQP